MAMDTVQRDPSAGTGAKVDLDGNAIVTAAGYSKTGTVVGGGPAAGPAIFSENDAGIITGARYVLSPETDDDYRLRVAHDHILDRETFNYTAQNTGKHSHAFTTVTATVSANGLLLNSGSGVATATGMTFGTFAEFPCGLTAQSLYCETNFALNQAMNAISANAVIDLGMFRRGATTAFAPTDGAYFRFTNAGITAVINNNGTENTQLLTNPNFTANENHLYGIIINEKNCEFWIDNELYGEIITPAVNAQAVRSSTLPWSVRYANTGAVTGALQGTVTDYLVSIGGAMFASSFSQIGNRSLGSHQGLSGGTMGALSSITTNSQAIPASGGSNTAAAATGLGGVGTLAAAVAGATDIIITGYQVPAGSVSAQGRRLVIYGVHISAINQVVAVATTATTLLLGLAFGSTALSLATADTASFATGTTKAPRREALGFMTWPVAAPVGAMPQSGDLDVKFSQPIYVNPGEFVQTYAKFVIGTATATETFVVAVNFDYGWE